MVEVHQNETCVFMLKGSRQGGARRSSQGDEKGKWRRSRSKRRKKKKKRRKRSSSRDGGKSLHPVLSPVRILDWSCAGPVASPADEHSVARFFGCSRAKGRRAESELESLLLLVTPPSPSAPLLLAAVSAPPFPSSPSPSAPLFLLPHRSSYCFSRLLPLPAAPPPTQETRPTPPPPPARRSSFPSPPCLRSCSCFFSSRRRHRRRIERCERG